MIATTLAALAGVLFVSGLSAGSRLRPAVLHNLAWFLGLGIVASGVMGYQEILPKAWSMIGISIVAFNVGVAMISVSRSRGVPIRPAGAVALWQFKVLLFAFGIGVIAYLLTISKLFGLDVLLTDPRAIRAATDVNYLAEFPTYAKLLFYLGPVCLVLALFPQYVKGLTGRPWRLPVLAIVAFAQLLTLQRTNLFVALVWVIGLLAVGAQPVWFRPLAAKLRRTDGHASPARRVASIAVLLIVGLVVFQGLASALGKTGRENADLTRSVDARLKNSSLVSPMFYASSGIPAFSNLVGSTNTSAPPARAVVYGDYNPHTYGAATFSGLTRVLPGVATWNEVAPFTRIPQPTNVYTWIEPWFRDFREFGVILGSLCMGLVIGAAARRATRSVTWQLAAGLLVGLSFLATFVNRYGMVMTIVIYLTLALLSKAGLGRMAPSRLGKPQALKL